MTMNDWVTRLIGEQSIAICSLKAENDELREQLVAAQIQPFIAKEEKTENV